MHKFLFHALLIILSCISSQSWASNNLCPPSERQVSTPTDVSTEQYQQAMQQAIESGSRLDWVDDEDSNACHGYYATPANPNPEKNLSPETTRLIASAESLSYRQQGISIFEGNVQAYQGNIRFSCDKLTYNQADGDAELIGNVQFRQDNVLVLADNIRLESTEQQIEVSGVQFLMPQLQIRGASEQMAIDNRQGGQFSLENTSFTTCPPNQEHWSISSESLKIDQSSGWGVAEDAWIHIEEIPVLYLPYLDFPIDDRRKTGVLFPSISSANGGGIDLAVPIYFNLAPHYDLTYIPRYNHAHGLLNAIEGRYKQAYSEWQVTGAYIDDDKRIGDIDTSENPSIDSRRWLGAVKEKGQFNENWSTLIDFTQVSDVDYFRDWGSAGLDIQKTLNIKRQAQLNYRSQQWSVNSSIIDYQTLEQQKNPDGSLSSIEEPYRYLPRIDIAYFNQLNNFSVNPLYSGEYTYFDHSSFNRAHRLHNRLGINYPMRWQAFQLQPTLLMRRTDFSYTGSQGNNNAQNVDLRGEKAINSASFSADAQLFFERQLSVNSQRLRQTLTPRLFYLYNDFDEGQEKLNAFDTTENSFSYQQLFRDSRFSGLDRLDDANQLSWALESVINSASTGQQILSMGIGQILYFDDRQVVLNADDNRFKTINSDDSKADIALKNAQNRLINKKYYRNRSDIALNSRVYWHQQHSISVNALIDPSEKEFEEGNFAYHFQSPGGYLFNLGYRYKKQLLLLIPNNDSTDNTIFNNNSNQVDVSAYFPISRDWNIFARTHYDMNKQEQIDNISGLEYSGCCFNVKLAYQRQRNTFDNNGTLNNYDDASYENIWHIQFELKGLGGSSGSLNRVLSEQIQGYQARE